MNSKMDFSGYGDEVLLSICSETNFRSWPRLSPAMKIDGAPAPVSKGRALSSALYEDVRVEEATDASMNLGPG